jgi:hypothetical protein
MKIQLDTEKKTVKIEDNILLGEFIDRIKLILPNKTWKEFTLLTGTIVEWINPYYIPYPVYPTIPVRPNLFTAPWITYTTGTVSLGSSNSVQSGTPEGITTTEVAFNSGIYNIEVQ